MEAIINKSKREQQSALTKVANRLRRNPVEFRNLCRTYIACLLASDLLQVFEALSQEVTARVISCFTLEEINFLEVKMLDVEIDLEVKLKSLVSYFKRQFRFKKRLEVE
jgi:hypothetical protein